MAAPARSIAGRNPPSNLDAEGAVLSSSLLSFEAFDQARAVLGSPDAFYSDANRQIFEACCAIADAGRTPDLVTVVGWLRENDKLARVGSPYLSQVVDATPAVSRVEDYAKIVRDLAAARRLLEGIQVLSADAYTELGDPRKWIDRVEQEVYRAAETPNETPAAEWIGEVAQRVYENSGKAARGELPTGRTTGIPELDQLTGGMCNGAVWIIAGRPGMGKSAFVEGVYELVAQNGELVFVFSLEMDRDQVTRRGAARQTLTAYRNLKLGSLERQEWTDYAQWVANTANLPIKIDDTPSMSPARIRARIRRYLAEGRRVFGAEMRLGCIVIDYLQLLSADGDHGNRVEALESITRELKRLAREFQCVVLVPCQMNRHVETKSSSDRRPTLAELRGSGSIEQDADFVVGLYREGYYRTKDDPLPPAERDIAEFIVLKGRESDTGTVFGRWDGPTTRFYPLYQDQPQRSLAL